MSKYGLNGPTLKLKICKIRFLKLNFFDFQISNFQNFKLMHELVFKNKNIHINLTICKFKYLKITDALTII